MTGVCIVKIKVMTLDRVGNIQKSREYRFAMAFGNSAYAGYVTEKLVDARDSVVAPNYWGG